MGWFSRKEPGVQKVEITISMTTLLRVMISVVVLLLAFAALRKMSGALIIIFVSVFLALALNAPVHWLASHFPGKRRGSRTLGTSLAYLAIVAFIGLVIGLLVPAVINQTSNFVQAVPNIVSDVRDENTSIGNFVSRYNLGDDIDEIATSITESAKSSSGKIFTSIGSAVVAVVTTLVLTFMMLVEGPHWIKILTRLVPRDKRTHATRLANDMYKVIKGYVNGQVTLAAVAAVAILPIMLIMGVPYAGALAFIVFLAGLVPMLGHYVGATIVTLIALTHWWVSAVVVLAYYIIYQQIENYAIQPKVQASTTNMSPLLVFAAVVIGAHFNGLLGALVAIPIMGCLRIIMLDYLKSRGKLD